MTSLDRLIAPTSIAIVGLSADPRKHGGRVLSSLRRLGYSGTIRGVHPATPDIDGVEMYASLLDLPQAPDLVASAVPAPVVPEVVRQAGEIGAGSAVIFAGGFAEQGSDGVDAQRRLSALAAETGVRVLGPNSGGVIRPSAGLAVSFLTCLDRPAEEIRTGPVRLVTQSGGTGSYIHNLAAERGSGLGISISTGNEADIDIADGIAALADLDEIRVIAVVLETIRDGAAFVDAVEEAHRSGKPVVVCRLGSSDHGRAMTSTHTGALAIPGRVLDGVLASSGITLTETPGELLEVAEVMARTTVRPGNRVGIVTHSGGIAILLSDLAARHDLTLPQPSSGMREGLIDLLEQGTAANPLDMGGIIGGAARFGQVVERFVDSHEFDLVLAVSTAHPRSHSIERAKALVAGDSDVIHLWMAGDVGADGLDVLREANRPVATEPRAAIRAIAGLTTPVPDVIGTADRLAGAPRRAPLDESRSKEILADWGVATPAGRLVTSAADAAAAAIELGDRVVVKACSADLLHKTEAGAVVVGVPTDRVAETFDLVMSRARERAPSAVVSGAIIEEHLDGFEIIVGGITDDRFGALILVGLGGVAAEAFEPAMGLPPSSHEQSAAFRSRVAGLDATLRRIDPLAAGQLDELLLAVSVGFTASDVIEFEMNPLAWTNRGWVALDALVVPLDQDRHRNGVREEAT